MTKEELMALGLTEAQATAVIAAHKADLKDKFVPIERLNEKISELKTAKDQVDERDGQIKDLKKFEGDKDALTQKIKDLETANKTKDDEYTKNLATERKQNAIKLQLLNAEQKPAEGALDLCVGLIDPELIQMDENGNITGGFKEQFEKATKEKSFLFDKKVEANPEKNPPWAPKGTKPADSPDGKKEPQTASQFGASLAGEKLAMSGIKPKSDATV